MVPLSGIDTDKDYISVDPHIILAAIAVIANFLQLVVRIISCKAAAFTARFRAAPYLLVLAKVAGWLRLAGKVADCVLQSPVFGCKYPF